MKRIVIAFFLPGIALVLAGCPGDVEVPPENDVAVCLEGEPFVADGNVPVDTAPPGDANRISDLRWEAHEGCERFVIDLATDDERPASSPGQVSAEILRDLGVVRISLPDVRWVDPDATDRTFGGELANRAYVMWSADGRWVDVDLHLGGEAEVHVALLEEPGRVLVDLRPGGGAIPEPAVTNDHVVVIDPRPGEATYPLTVTGYSRTFEANVVARLEQEGETVEDTFTTATAWADAWGYYSLTFDDGPTGLIELHVGEHSAKDGTWEGVMVELDMR